MKIAFFSYYLNHHQMPLCEAFNSLPNVEYTFVATTGIPDFRKRLGYSEHEESYQLDVTKSEKNRQLALNLALDADVAIFATQSMEEFIIPRLKTGKLTFAYSERWLKKDFKLNLLSPNLWKHQLMYYRYGRKANLYMLCASAYAPNDYYLLNSYKNRCLKWAYFTKVNDLSIESVLAAKRGNKTRIMWCSRFIRWKHPELVVKLASLLKRDNFEFVIDMYGEGPLTDKIMHLIGNLGVSDCVHVKGAIPNVQVLIEMQKHHIFLFTSDQNEGWGAVANEAMSNGCTIVGSDAIGAVPFLVRNGVNGQIFTSGSLSSLYASTKELVCDRKKCEDLAIQAYKDMHDIWSPCNAAYSLITFIQSINTGLENPILQGPCSKAEPI